METPVQATDPTSETLGKDDEETPDKGIYQRPKALFTSAAMVLAVSIIFPYWRLKLVAPQFPQGS